MLQSLTSFIGEVDAWDFGSEMGARKVVNFQDPKGVAFQLVQQSLVTFPSLNPYAIGAEFRQLHAECFGLLCGQLYWPQYRNSRRLGLARVPLRVKARKTVMLQASGPAIASVPCDIKMPLLKLARGSNAKALFSSIGYQKCSSQTRLSLTSDRW